MNNMAKRMKRNSISRRLLVYYVTIILIPFSILFLVVIKSYRNSVMEVVREKAEESLNLINYNINQQFISYSSLSYFLTRDRQLRDVGYETGAAAYNRKVNKKNIRNLLNAYRQSVDGVARVAVSFQNGILLSSDSEDAKEHNPVQQGWYQLCLEEPEDYHILNYEADEEILQGYPKETTPMINVCRAFLDKDGSFLGAVSVEMQSQVLEKSMSYIMSRKGSYVYILNQEGKPVISPIVNRVPSPGKNRQEYTLEVYNELNSWTIVGVVPLERYNRQQAYAWKLLLLMLSVIGLLMLYFTYRISNSIARPVRTLKNLMARAEAGDLTVRFSESGSWEIEDLGKSFNIMVERLDHYITQVGVEQQEKVRAEMEVLQANIKPHFLYNTLDTIHWMARTYHADDIVDTVDALATFFRVALSKGKETITVEQELVHVLSYLAIQKVRYEDMISYEVHVQENCKGLMVQKLILQPLVENALYHGIKDSGRNGIIRIDVRREADVLILEVQDDGLGIGPQKLQELNHLLKNYNLASEKAYGILNVHYRIFISYGAPYGLTLYSGSGKGTIARILHPVIEKGEDHVESSNRR